MKALKFRSAILLQAACAAFCLLASGCANPYRNNYLSTIQKWPGGVSSRLLMPTGDPQLLTSEDVKKDSQNLLESGYVLLGRAKFRDRKLDEAMAIQQGQSIGAWVVVVQHKYVTTVTESVPIGQWTPDQTTVTQTTTQVQRDPNKPPVDIQQQTVQTVQGQFQTTYVPQNVDYFDYSASFWGKAKPSPIGVLVQPLNDDQKKAYQTNKGVIVMAVIHDTPAFNADILKGDFLTSLAGEEIRTPEQFFDIVSRNAGKTVELDYIRDGHGLSAQVALSKD